jgi:ABC-2 type transport system ATP-binding protein
VQDAAKALAFPYIMAMPSNSSNNMAFQATDLAKSYGRTCVLDGINLEVPDGEAFGLVGINGAGKTTLIKCLLDFCSVDSGNLRIFGVSHKLPHARERIAFVPEQFAPPHYLTCNEFMKLAAALGGSVFDSGQVEQLFEELRLDHAALGRPVRQLSKGMTQKLGLAGCFLVRRDMYVLDEPMSGLDPASRVAVKAVLARLIREGRTLFFTSHVLSDVEELCSSIAVLDRGKIRFKGAPRALCERYAEPNLEGAFMRCIDVSESSIAH